MNDLFSQNFLLLFKSAVAEASRPYFERMVDHASLSSKEFWTTRELVDRGWTLKQLDTYVTEGRLARINAGGSAGFKYPSIQLLKIINHSYDSSHTSSAQIPGRK